MPVRTNTVEIFKSGTHNRLDNEDIPKDAAAESIGWQTRDGRVELMYGRQVVGNEGGAGKNLGEHTGYKTDGTEVSFRKIWDGTEGKVQYLNGSTWTNVITGLANADMTFTNYASLAGNFVYCSSPEDGIFKIVTANPGSYTDVYAANTNFKGYSFIDKGRMILWGRLQDTTGLYGSHIDDQSTPYTTVSGEAVAAVESGTLAFKAGNPLGTCFGVTITDTSSGEVFTDNYDGTLTGDAGGTGTINYTTGAFTITGQTGAGTADYQWENSNNNGVTDFTKSATRVAGEGFVVRQDAGGDAIKVVLPHDGAYFSVKQRSVYQFTPDVEDLNPTNELIRTDIGVDTLRGAVATSRGVVVMDTGNPTEPTPVILQRNLNGDNFTTQELFPQFKFSNYSYDDVSLFTWDEFVVVACNEGVTTENNRLLMLNLRKDTVDVAPYGLRTFTKKGGFLYGGDPVSQNTYELFTGFDDLNTKIQNEWISSGDIMGGGVLKKVKKMRFRGLIDPQQCVSIYISTEGGGWQKIGTIKGDGDYVDYSSSFAIGSSYIGQETIGGGEDTAHAFLIQIKTCYGKFRKRQVRFVADGYGYVAFNMMQDFDIWTYQDKIPSTYRQKQNVSLDGTSTDLDDPE